MKFCGDNNGCNVTAIIFTSPFLLNIFISFLHCYYLALTQIISVIIWAKLLVTGCWCFRSELVAAMTSVGNHLANSVWEASLKGRVKPSPSTHRLIMFSCSYNPSSAVFVCCDISCSLSLWSRYVLCGVCISFTLYAQGWKGKMDSCQIRRQRILASTTLCGRSNAAGNYCLFSRNVRWSSVCSDLQLVAYLTAVWEDSGLNVTAAVVFITTATVLYRLGHGLHTRTAVPRRTEPSVLHGTVKWL